mmetsp:Transcript_50983/g.129493  ORF Transcript_50983/g.129493 Transcript_50983/m.129493 type:complete len:215 (-) Transcript_50983:853-1497(-)
MDLFAHGQLLDRCRECGLPTETHEQTHCRRDGPQRAHVQVVSEPADQVQHKDHRHTPHRDRQSEQELCRNDAAELCRPGADKLPAKAVEHRPCAGHAEKVLDDGRHPCDDLAVQFRFHLVLQNCRDDEGQAQQKAPELHREDLGVCSAYGFLLISHQLARGHEPQNLGDEKTQRHGDDIVLILLTLLHPMLLLLVDLAVICNSGSTTEEASHPT